MVKLFLLAVLLYLATIAGVLIYRDRPRPAPKSTDPKVRLHGRGTYECAVLGVSSYRFALERIYGDDVGKWNGKKVQAVLVPENAGQRRNKLVRVEIEDRTVGYLAGAPAKECRRQLRKSRYSKARGVCKGNIIVRPHRGVGGYTDFAVHLDLPPSNDGRDGKPRPRIVG